MRVQSNCKSCTEKIAFWSWSEDRVRLAMEKGETINFLCKRCGVNEEYHVNDFEAQPNKWLLTLAFIILLIAAPVFFYLVNRYFLRSNWVYSIKGLLSVLLLPTTVFALLLRDDRTKRDSFNSVKIKEKF